MASMIRTMRRRMVRRGTSRGLTCSKNKAGRFALVWTGLQAKATHARPKRRDGMIDRALARLGMRRKADKAVEV